MFTASLPDFRIFKDNSNKLAGEDEINTLDPIWYEEFVE